MEGYKVNSITMHVSDANDMDSPFLLSRILEVLEDYTLSGMRVEVKENGQVIELINP